MSLMRFQFHCIVKPNSRVDKIAVNADGSLRIKIKAPPVDGKANAYLVGYLAEVFGLPEKNIQIVSGFTNSHKRINIVAENSKLQTVLSNLKNP